MWKLFNFFLFVTLTITPFQLQALTITPNTNLDGFDGANCTLRDAIETINTGFFWGDCMAQSDMGPFGTDDTIVLDSLDYELTLEGQGEDCNQVGDLDIATSMSVIGAGPTQTTVRANFSTEADRVFDMVLGINCNSGNAQGVEGSGGLVGSVLLQGLTVTDGDVGETGDGGGIRSGRYGTTELFLSEVNVANNRAVGPGMDQDGGGIAIFQNASLLQMINSNVVGNICNNRGGGISFGFNDSQGTILANGAADLNGQGAPGLPHLIQDSTIDDNEGAAVGGGVFQQGNLPLVIDGSTISNNRVIVPPPVNINGAGFANAGSGGGIHVGNNLFYVINSTISENFAENSGGGVLIQQIASQSQVQGDQAAFYNVTIANNQSGDGMGGGLLALNNLGNAPFVQGISVQNTIIAGNTANVGPDCTQQNPNPFVSGGFNLIGNDADCQGFSNATNDQLNIDPVLGPLAANGGPTQTMALLQGSPAIDMGSDNPTCQAPELNALLNMLTVNLVDLNVDQRDFPRPVDGSGDGNARCDIGAFEAQALDFEVSKTDDTQGPVPLNSNFNYLITLTNLGPDEASNVTLSDPLPPQVEFVTVEQPTQGTCVGSAATNLVTCDFGNMVVGDSITVTVQVRAVQIGEFTNVVTITATGAGSQQTITRTAQVSTVVTGSFSVEGSGCGSSLLGNSSAPLHQVMGWALLIAMTLFAHGVIRKTR